MPAHADAFAFFPVLYTGSDLVDHAGDLVSGNARIRDTGKQAVFGEDIAVTDSTGLNANPHLSRAGLRNLAFHDFEVRSRLRYLHCFHFCHFAVSPFCPVNSLAAWVFVLHLDADLGRGGLGVATRRVATVRRGRRRDLRRSVGTTTFGWGARPIKARMRVRLSFPSTLARFGFTLLFMLQSHKKAITAVKAAQQQVEKAIRDGTRSGRSSQQAQAQLPQAKERLRMSQEQLES